MGALTNSPVTVEKNLIVNGDNLIGREWTSEMDDNVMSEESNEEKLKSQKRKRKSEELETLEVGSEISKSKSNLSSSMQSSPSSLRRKSNMQSEMRFSEACSAFPHSSSITIASSLVAALTIENSPFGHRHR